MPRAMHTATAMGTSMVVYGGTPMWTGAPIGDIAILDTSQGEPFHWTVVPAAETGWPTARERHSANAIGDKIFVFGGYDGSEYKDELYVLDSSLKWESVKTTGGSMLCARSDHSTCVLDDCRTLVMIGGYDG